ncbi:MAG: hypothetical protein AAFR61_18685 [Bacteroidota bacterium]
MGPFSRQARLLRLAEKVAEGDRKAMLSLREQLFGKGMGFLQNQGLTHAEAEEAAQKKLTDLISRLIRGEKIQAVEAYYFKALKNELGKLAREKQRLVPLEEGTLSPEKEAHDPMLEAEKEEEKRLRVKIARQAFQQLGAGCQKVLGLFFQGARMGEIALEIGLSGANSAKTRKSQCLKRLIQLYHQQQ